MTLVAAGAAAGAAEFHRAPELPDMGSFRERLKDQPAPESAGRKAVGPASAEGTAACADLKLGDDAVIEGRLFSWTHDIKSGGRKIATIESKSRGYDVKSADGGLLASGRVKYNWGGRVVTVEDCAGQAQAGSHPGAPPTQQCGGSEHGRTLTPGRARCRRL